MNKVGWRLSFKLWKFTLTDLHFLRFWHDCYNFFVADLIKQLICCNFGISKKGIPQPWDSFSRLTFILSAKWIAPILRDSTARPAKETYRLYILGILGKSMRLDYLMYHSIICYFYGEISFWKIIVFEFSNRHFSLINFC